MQGGFLSICLFAALLLEVFLGSRGVSIPLFACVVFYFGVLRMWRRAFVFSLVFALILDGAQAHFVPTSLLLVTSAILLARLWSGFRLTYSFFWQTVPGFFVGCFAELTHFMAPELWSDGAFWRMVLWMAPRIMVSGAFGAVLQPILCKLLDYWSGRMGLLQYARAGALSGTGSSPDGFATIEDTQRGHEP